MIRLDLKNYVGTSRLRRPIYRAVCKDGHTRLGYLVFVAQRHWFRPATEKVFLRESITGRLHRFRPETLTIWTLLMDRESYPICNGDLVIRYESYTNTSVKGQVLYCNDVSGFVFVPESGKAARPEPMYTKITVCEEHGEYKLNYSYSLINKPK